MKCYICKGSGQVEHEGIPVFFDPSNWTYKYIYRLKQCLSCCGTGILTKSQSNESTHKRSRPSV